MVCSKIYGNFLRGPVRLAPGALSSQLPIEREGGRGACRSATIGALSKWKCAKQKHTRHCNC